MKQRDVITPNVIDYEGLRHTNTAPCPLNAHQSPPRSASRPGVWRAWPIARKRREGAGHLDAHEAAVAAVQSVLPLPWKEASAEAVNAVAYATKYHSEWFWRGAQAKG
jgi:hypothetical protein